LRIAVNTRLLLSGKLEGIGWFTCQTFKKMVKNHPECEFHFIFDRQYNPEFIFADNVKPVVLFPQARHPLLYYLFFEQSLPRYLGKTKPDLFVSPDGLLSLAYSGKQVPVFHDLNFMHHPHYLPFLSRKYYTGFFPKYAKISERIATVSEYSKKDIIKTFGYPAEKIDVVYNGVNEIFRPVEKGRMGEIREKYARGFPYFVYVGSLHKRKNIDRMLQAFEQFKKSDNGGHKLVIVGEPMFGSLLSKKIYTSMNSKDDVIFVGRLYEEELRDVIGGSTALLLVSHFEGFGIPILEAMNCDVPVITSNVTSMPEVAGGAALLVDPGSVQSIANAMQKITAEPALRNTLIEKGRTQRERFSWEKTAERMWECLEKAMEK